MSRVFAVTAMSHQELAQLRATIDGPIRASCANASAGPGLQDYCGLDQAPCPGFEHCPYDVVELCCIRTVDNYQPSAPPVSAISTFNQPTIIGTPMTGTPMNPVLAVRPVFEPPKPRTESVQVAIPELPVKVVPSEFNSAHPLYKVWYRLCSGMTNPKSTYWKQYGAKGFKFHAEWTEFVNFALYCIGNGWVEGSRVDRHDRKGDFTPKNLKIS